MKNFQDIASYVARAALAIATLALFCVYSINRDSTNLGSWYIPFAVLSIGIAIKFCYWFRLAGALGIILTFSPPTNAVLVALGFIQILMVFATIQAKVPLVPTTKAQVNRAAWSTALAAGIATSCLLEIGLFNASSTAVLSLWGKEATATISHYEEDVVGKDGGPEAFVAYVRYAFETYSGAVIVGEGSIPISRESLNSDQAGKKLRILYLPAYPAWNAIGSKRNQSWWISLYSLVVVIGSGVAMAHYSLDHFRTQYQICIESAK